MARTRLALITTAALCAAAPVLRLGSPPELVKLNVPEALTLVDDVVQSVISPDGATVVVQVQGASRNELLAIPIDGFGVPVFLADSFFGDPELAISPDSSRLIYRTSSNLFSVPIDGTASAVRLDDPLVPASDVAEFVFTPGSQRVVYVTDINGTFPAELFTVPIDGSALPAKLNPTVLPVSNVREFLLTPDGTRVVFNVDAEVNHIEELYVSPVDASAPPTKLSGSTAPFMGAWSARVTADSSLVVFRADLGVSGRMELHTVPIDGSSPPTKISDNVGMNQFVANIELSNDGTQVLYQLYTNFTPSGLYVLPVDGSGSSTLLSTVGLTPNFYPTPDDAHVVFGGSGGGLFTVPLDGSAAPAMIQGTNVEEFELSGDSAWVVYRFDNGVGKVYTSPTDASATPIRLNGNLGPSGSVRTFSVTNDATRVVYQADEIVNGVDEVFVAPIDGAAQGVRISAAIEPDRSVDGFSVSADSTTIVYRADADVLDASEAYGVDISGGPGWLLEAQLTPKTVGVSYFDVAAGGVVYADDEIRRAPVRKTSASVQLPGAPGVIPDSADISPLGGYVVFLDGVMHEALYAVPADGSGPPVQIGGKSPSFRFASDDSFVLVSSQRNLDAAPLDGSPPTSLVSGTLSNTIYAFELSPDETRALYIRVDDAGHSQLHSRLVDASAPAVQINVPAHPDANVLAFRIVPALDAVFFHGDQNTQLMSELFRAPLDGSTPPVQISAPTVGSLGNVTHWDVSPDAQWVAYSATATSQFRRELFTVSADGTGPHIKLFPTPTGGGVQSLEITPDSKTVVFHSSMVTFQQSALYAAPIDGSAAHYSLYTDPRPPVDPVLVDSASEWVFFRAYRPGSSILAELYRARIAVPDSSQLLSGPLVPGGRVDSQLHLADDDGHILYTADAEVVGKRELYSVATDGSRPARKLSGESPAFATVATESSGGSGPCITPSGERVVFRVDRETDDVWELFSVALGPALTSAQPASASYEGGATIRLNGCDFEPGTRVFFAGIESPSVSYVSATALDVIVPRSARLNAVPTGVPRRKTRAVHLAPLPIALRVENGPYRSTVGGIFSYAD